MKKIKVVLLCLVLALSSLAFVGCKAPLDTDDGYVEVMSVSYGDKKISSGFRLTFENEIEISVEEYDSFSASFKKGRVYHELSRDKSNVNDFVLEHDYVYGSTEFSPETLEYETHYYKRTLKKIDFEYVSVKIVDSRSLYIKTFDGKETLYSGEGYVVEYFSLN